MNISLLGHPQHVCIFGTDIDVFENRSILTIVAKLGDLRRCTGLQHDARTRSAREITVGDASRVGCVANCLRWFGRIQSTGNAGRVSAREQMAREVLDEPSALYFECVSIEPFHGWPTMGV